METTPVVPPHVPVSTSATYVRAAAPTVPAVLKMAERGDIFAQFVSTFGGTICADMGGGN